MSVELIDLSPGVEQDLVVPYGERNIRMQIRYNSFFNYWWVSLYDDDTDVSILTGIRFIPDVNILDSLQYLGLGLLGIWDTQSDSDLAITRADLGGRLKLYRSL